MFSCRRRVARSYLLGHRELAFEIVVPGSGDFDDVVAASERGDVDGAAARLGVSDDGVPPVVVDGDIVSHAGIINDGDHAQFTAVVHIGHISRRIYLDVMVNIIYFHLYSCWRLIDFCQRR